MDQQSVETTFHIFDRTDKRFSLSQNEEGFYCISLSQPIAEVNLSAEQKQALEEVAPYLLEAFSQQRRIPWTIFEILEQIKCLATASPRLETLHPIERNQWLYERDEWAKVGRDLWFPKRLPLSTMLANNRQQLVALRHFYMKNAKK